MTTMQKFDVIIHLEGIREASQKWREAKRQFDKEVRRMMRRLLHEAAANYMSDLDVARASGLHVRQVRTMMAAAGLDPRNGKTLLAGKASKVLAENAEAMGIEPHEMDLMSPLAYLPMGDEMKRRLTEASVSKVTEVPEEIEWDEDRFLETLTSDIRAFWDTYEYDDITAKTLDQNLAKHLLDAGWHK